MSPAAEAWQLRFDAGRQQRYFADRRALLECVERISRHSPDPRFEVWTQREGAVLSDGTRPGRTFELVEVWDLREAGVRERLRDELGALRAAERPLSRRQ